MNARRISTDPAASSPPLEAGRLGHVATNELSVLRDELHAGALETLASAERVASLFLVVGVAPEVFSDALLGRVHEVARRLPARPSPRGVLQALAPAATGWIDVDPGPWLDAYLLDGAAPVRDACLRAVALAGGAPERLAEAMLARLPLVARRRAGEADRIGVLLASSGVDPVAILDHLPAPPRDALTPRLLEAGDTVPNPWSHDVFVALARLATRLAAALPEPDGQLRLGFDASPVDARRVVRLVGKGPRFGADVLLARVREHPFAAPLLGPRVSAADANDDERIDDAAASAPG